MSFFLLKTILAIFFLAAAVGAVTSMLAMMGKTDKKTGNRQVSYNFQPINGRRFTSHLPARAKRRSPFTSSSAYDTSIHRRRCCTCARGERWYSRLPSDYERRESIAD